MKSSRLRFDSLALHGSIQKTHLHGIPPAKGPGQLRASISFRELSRHRKGCPLLMVAADVGASLQAPELLKGSDLIDMRIDRVAPSSGKPMMFLMGASGVGKSSIARLLVRAYPGLFAVVKSHTSRPKRPSDVMDEDCIFVTEEAMLSKISNGEFVEHACVYGNYYGVERSGIDARLAGGVAPILVLDRHGVESFAEVAEFYHRMVVVNIVVKSAEEARRRLLCRASDPQETIERRMLLYDETVRVNAECGLVGLTVQNDSLEATFMKVVRHYIDAMPCDRHEECDPTGSDLRLGRVVDDVEEVLMGTACPVVITIHGDRADLGRIKSIAGWSQKGIGIPHSIDMSDGGGVLQGHAQLTVHRKV